MMKTLLLLLLLCHVSSSVKHSLKYYTTASSGVPNLPEFMMLVQIDDIQGAYCDGSNKIYEPRQDWMKKLYDDNPQLWTQVTQDCFQIQPQRFKNRLNSFIQLFHHSEGSGVHILQVMSGCELDETTGEVTGFVRYGYNGEDFIELDLKTLTWTTLRPEADIIKQKWDEDTDRIRDNEQFLTQNYPEHLKLFLKYGNSSLLRTDLPSVSLLQKTPSSPVSCHAAGFYPDRAMMFWRKDGEEIHEGVEHGEILPNHDGSFQMNVDLDISSVSPEDWRRYDCVFHLSGVEDDIITKLDETQIRTNTVRHSLKYYTTASSGVPNLPEFMSVAEVDDIQVVHCDGSNKIFEPRQDWMKKLFDENPQIRKWHTEQCFQIQPQRFKNRLNSLIQLFNHSEGSGVHILQRIEGCEWNETTGEVTCFGRYGYDGEDFIELDLKTLTWTVLRPEADIIKQKQDGDTFRIKDDVEFLTQIYREWMKLILKYGNNSLLRTDVPSVSLLQKTPSSPVSCHATGFYPDRAMMFWRKDGEEIHEGVEHGEILPNHDGSFQMNVDLDISSVSPEDWRRYNCVFHLSGVEDGIITKLDKAQIRTNWGYPRGLLIVRGVGLLLLMVVAISGLIIWRNKRNV
ncbi:major histocompatibility complex class I-related gene protein-like [Mugil cephalus]|uniref:major histocompatibility complex class I-related gene protein-like n=1 Tax=Mugil cephalus TaxID=48193 RepID=UPI001FB8494E|nr:major histocompatibility complex class I-related gene protein-like [Mugil cephalus]